MRHLTTDPVCVEHRPPVTGPQRRRFDRKRGQNCPVCWRERTIAKYSLEARAWSIEHGAAGDVLVLAAYDAGREARIDARPPRTYRAHGSKQDTAPVTTVPSDINTPPRRWQASDGRPLLDYAAIGTTLLSQNPRPVGSMTPAEHAIATVIEALGRALITLGPHE
jgi:hypothetical protein